MIRIVLLVALSLPHGGDVGSIQDLGKPDFATNRLEIFQIGGDGIDRPLMQGEEELTIGQLQNNRDTAALQLNAAERELEEMRKKYRTAEEEFSAVQDELAAAQQKVYLAKQARYRAEIERVIALSEELQSEILSVGNPSEANSRRKIYLDFDEETRATLTRAYQSLTGLQREVNAMRQGFSEAPGASGNTTEIIDTSDGNPLLFIK